MAGTRLEYWSTLNHEELRRRVEIEQQRMVRDSTYSFADKQLLDAARERLANWRTSMRAATKEKSMKKKAAEPVATDQMAAPPSAAPVPKAESAPKQGPTPDWQQLRTVEELVASYNEMVLTASDVGLRVSTTKSFPDVKTGQLACERLHVQISKARATPAKKEETTAMAKTAKKATTKSAPKAKAATKKTATKANGTKRAVLEPNTMIAWTGKENPFREGSGKHERVECVRVPGRASVKTILAKRKATTGTIRWCINHGHAKAEA